HFGPTLHRGLFRRARGPDVRPALADHVTVSADGSSYRFRLRQGLRWSDGEPLTAADFAFTFRAMGERQGQTAHLLAGLEFDAPGGGTGELRISHPRPLLPHLLPPPPPLPRPPHPPASPPHA